jgi:hypothetical protein
MLLSCFCAWAQNDSLKTADVNNKVRNIGFMSDIRLIFIKPNAVGDNFLAKGNSGQFGLGLRLGLFKAYDFSVAVGGDLLYYDTTNAAYGGDTNSININSGSVDVMYNITIKKFTIIPKISAGYSVIYYNADGERGNQGGARIGAGIMAEYSLTRRISFFIGTDYTITYPEVKTNTAYENFFGKVNQVNILAGIKFTIKD